MAALVNELKLLPDGNTLDPVWASEVFGFGVTSGRFVDGKGLEGGQVGLMKRLEVTSTDGRTTTYIVKSTGPSATNPGAAREAYFYNELASTLILADGTPITPKCIYAKGDMKTGEKILVLEDLSAGVVAGYMIEGGEGSHPYTWGDKAESTAAQTAAGPGAVAVIRSIVQATAVIHAKFWGAGAVNTIPWIAGNSTELREEWEKLMGWSKGLWQKQRTGVEGVTINPNLVKIMDASFEQLSWDAHEKFKTNTKLTLIQGDFHPFNAIMNKERAVLFDWEMVKVGSAGQDLGQFMLGNVKVSIRRSCEKDLVQMYCDLLIQSGVNSEECSFESIWNEYVFGGAAKWIWLMPIMTTILPKKDELQWFYNQLSEFCKDHNVTPDNIGPPRS